MFPGGGIENILDNEIAIWFSLAAVTCSLLVDVLAYPPSRTPTTSLKAHSQPHSFSIATAIFSLKSAEVRSLLPIQEFMYP